MGFLALHFPNWKAFFIVIYNNNFLNRGVFLILDSSFPYFEELLLKFPSFLHSKSLDLSFFHFPAFLLTIFLFPFCHQNIKYNDPIIRQVIVLGKAAHIIIKMTIGQNFRNRIIDPMKINSPNDFIPSIISPEAYLLSNQQVL